jgi:Putative transposase
LPAGYFHVVFTVPAEVAAIAFHNKAVVYDLLFRAASQTMLTIAADPKHLGARISAAHVGICDDPSSAHPYDRAWRWHFSRWRAPDLVPACLPALGPSLIEVVPALVPYAAARAARRRSAPVLWRSWRTEQSARVPVRKTKWVVYAKPPFGGPEVVLAYLSRYTHRVAISNRRLIAFDETGVTFRYKDYRRDGKERQLTMTLSADEFIRRFLLHVLPKGFHRIRHYGLLAGAGRKTNVARARELPAIAASRETEEPVSTTGPRPSCPCCGRRGVNVQRIALNPLQRIANWQMPIRC